MTSETVERDPLYGWLMVAIAAICSGLGFGALTSAAVFLAPLADEFGWSRGSVSFAYTIGGIASAIFGLGIGYLANRMATRVFTLFGIVMLSLPLAALSFIEALWQLHALYAAMGGLGFAALTAPIMATASRWVRRSPGLAIGIMTAGGAVGQGIVPLVAGYLIVALGWRDAYFALGVAFLAIGVPMALLVRESPPLSVATGDAARAAMPPLLSAPVAMIWVGIAAIFCCICMAVPIMHVVALVTDTGLPPQVGAGVLTVLMVSGAVGRIAAGKIADRLGGVRTYMLTSVGQASLVFWFVQADSAWSFYAVAAAFGFAYAGVMTCLFIVIRELVPEHRFALGIAVVVMFGWVGMGVGAVQGGVLFDQTGNYNVSYASAAIAGYVNLAIVFALDRRLHTLRRRRLASAQT